MSSQNEADFDNQINTLSSHSFFSDTSRTSELQDDFQRSKHKISLKPMSLIEANEYVENNREIIMNNVDSELRKKIRSIRFWKIFDINKNPFIPCPIIINISLTHVLCDYLTDQSRVKELNIKSRIPSTSIPYIYKLLFIIPRSLSYTKLLHTIGPLADENEIKQNLSNKDHKTLKFNLIGFESGWLNDEIDALEEKLDKLLEPKDEYALKVLVTFYRELLYDVFKGMKTSDDTNDPNYKLSISYFNDVVAPVLELFNFANEQDTNKRAYMINNATNIPVKQFSGKSYPKFETRTKPEGSGVGISILNNQLNVDHVLNTPRVIMNIESESPKLFKETSNEQINIAKLIKESSQFQEIMKQSVNHSISLKSSFGAIQDYENTFFYLLPKKDNLSLEDSEPLSLNFMISNDSHQDSQSLSQINRVESRLMYAIFISQIQHFDKHSDANDDELWNILRRKFVVKPEGPSIENLKVEPGTTVTDTSTDNTVVINSNVDDFAKDSKTNTTETSKTFPEPVVKYSDILKLEKFDFPSLSNLYLVDCNEFQNLFINYIYEEDRDDLERFVNQNPNCKIIIKAYVKDEMMQHLIDREEYSYVDDSYSFKSAKEYTEEFLKYNVINEIRVNLILRKYNNEKLRNKKPDECFNVPLFLTSGVIIDENNWSAPVGTFVAFQFLDNLISLKDESDISGGLIPVIKKLHSMGISHGDIRLENVSKIEDNGEIVLMDFNRSEVLSDYKDDINWQRGLKMDDFSVLGSLRYDLGLQQQDDEDFSDVI
ncbi:hypothetical protein BN7_99 [Wickerhamomyces ciferrii]|uniref:Protein kinase domain-containing protein n=1 Tax=Wickerhamomyces ciferrii (strain ATCC 14091 / BCRC 22168 / CBS 111 / JCM 3599 / NBRC 0793 / NRRL Y-1031 F-60-10) TaxID=1206466 RepID=K0KCE2_WICCF|nr:uncharacterized protein BN7_99 [Wickerhamomyces ciferrii]CCH40566.1 hypothetical protein BN7_99 [Wickerhamomyces ciferrii]